MPSYTGDPNKTINLTTEEFTTQTPGHPNSFNPKFRQMLDNDANLDKRISDHKNASVLDHPDGSVTDAKIGDRTADPAQAPKSNGPGTLTQWLSWIANRIKEMLGTTNWYDAPPTTLTAAKAHIDDTVKHITDAERSDWNAKETPAGAQAKVDAHASRTDNPHAVTKAQVGLGNVQNYGIATQAQAEAGTANNVYMTPLRTKQAIDTHASRTDNPHNVTKAQVGLGNVQNYGIATKAQAEAGTANNVYMTPLRVQEKIANGISSNGTIQTTSGSYTARIRVTNDRAVIERIGPNFTGGIRIALTKVIEMGSNDTNPNGVYSAPPGSLCFSTPSSGNAGLFYKRSGTGNTGWVPVVDL